MTAEVIVSEWPRNGREVLRVRLSEFKGQPVVCIRAWYPGTDGRLAPGRDGLTVSVRHLPALAEAINRALELASMPVPEDEVARLRAEAAAFFAHADALEREGQEQDSP